MTKSKKTLLLTLFLLTASPLHAAGIGIKGIFIGTVLAGLLATQPIIDHSYSNLPQASFQESQIAFKPGKVVRGMMADERFRLWRPTRLDVFNNDGSTVGYLQSPWLSFRKTMGLYDVNNNLKSESRAAIFTLGNKIEVFSGNADTSPKIGEIRERVFENLATKITSFGTKSQYEIYQNGELVAQSERFNFSVVKKVELKDPNTGETLAILSKDLNRKGIKSWLVDNWDIDITDAGADVLDPKVLFHIAAQDTLHEGSSSSSSSSSSKSK